MKNKDTYSGRIVSKLVNGEKRLYVRPDQHKKDRPLNPADLSPALRELLAEDPGKLENRKVDYEYDSGDPRNVRDRGEPRPRAGQARPDRIVPAPQSPPPSSPGLATAFHNPYGFVPAIDRDTAHPDLGDRGDDVGHGHDRLRPGRYTGSIRVRMRVETPLLLLDTSRYDEDANQHRTYPVLERVVDGALRPHLPATAVKGMLRSAYEAVTNSRMGVFAGHDERLGYRMPATDGLRSVPARVGEDGRVHLLLGTTKLGEQQAAGQQEDSQDPPPLHAAWLPQYWSSPNRAGGRSPQRPRNLTLPGGVRPRHGQQVYAKVQLYQCIKKNKRNNRINKFRFWWVRAIGRTRAELPATLPPAFDNKTYRPVDPPEILTVRGYVCRTGKNIDNKHDERLFFDLRDTDPRSPYAVSPPPALADGIPVEEIRPLWLRSLAAYRQVTRTRENSSLTEESSRHLENLDAAERLEPGTLLYLHFDATSSSHPRPVGAYPVTISRDLYPVAPVELLPPSLRPADELTELSPADRVFGWVRTEPEKGRPRPLGAWRGCLRVGPVVCRQTSDGEPGAAGRHPESGGPAVERFGGQGLPLAILGAPKPTQGRFYVGHARDGRPVPLGSVRRKDSNGDVDRKGWYVGGCTGRDPRMLRGRKFYQHHAGLPPGYWDNPMEDRTQRLEGGRYQEYRRPRPVVDDKQPLNEAGTAYRIDESREQRDSQNRSVRGWVRPGTTFEFTVEVANLTRVELGALLWLLDLDGDWQTGDRKGNDRKGGSRKDGDRAGAAGRRVRRFHRLGFGKPLGFGSVALTIDWDQTDLADGEDWAEYFLDLSPALTPGEWLGGGRAKAVRELARDAVAAFQDVTARTYGETGARRFHQVQPIREFLAAATGDPAVPVHYPRKPVKERDQCWKGNPAIPPDPRGRSYEWFVANESPTWETQPLPELGSGETLSTWHGRVQRGGQGGAGGGFGGGASGRGQQGRGGFGGRFGPGGTRNRPGR